jgi:hypothetical protein
LIGGFVVETVTFNVYALSELEGAYAKQRAIKWCREREFYEYPWWDDALASLEVFANYLRCRIDDYEIDLNGCRRTYVKVSGDYVSEGELDALMGGLKTDGSCQHTGYYADDACNAGAIDAWKGGERDPVELVKAGFKTWLEAVRADYADLQSDERIVENADANGLRFTADGRPFLLSR